MKPYYGMTPDEFDAYLRRTEDQGGYDGRAQDPAKVAAADTIKHLHVALASQIEITNTERAEKERLTAAERRYRGLLLEALSHVERRPMSMCSRTPEAVIETIKALLGFPWAPHGGGPENG